MKMLIFVLILAVFSGGCTKMFIDIDNTPMDDYNLLFEYLTNDYAYKDAYPFTMNELKSRYLNEFREEVTKEKLAEIFIKIEYDLHDPHFQPPYQVYNITGKYSPNYGLVQTWAERDCLEPVFKEIDIISSNSYFLYGTLKDHQTIGYIYIKELSAVLGGAGRLKGNKWKEEIEQILKELSRKNVTKMIVDIRSDAGGSNYNALYIANRFANTTAPYMIEKYEKDKGEYGEIIYRVKPEGKYHFRDGKIALLSNNNTGSGGEMFVLAMLERQNLVHIGTHTAGCAGAIIERDLYNGWNFILTSSKTYFANGDTYFQKGIRPQIIVKNDADYYSTKQDKLIERAIVELEN